jgi:hypothetical protein
MESRLQEKYFVRRKTKWSNRLIQLDLLRKLTINDIFNGKSVSPSVIMQLICPTIPDVNIWRILYSFDLDVCGAGFNWSKVTISFACLQALNSGHTTCYATRVIPSDLMIRVSRLYKSQQGGLNIQCPNEFDTSAFLWTSLQDCNEIRPKRLYRFRRERFGDNCDAYSIQKRFWSYCQIKDI